MYKDFLLVQVIIAQTNTTYKYKSKQYSHGLNRWAKCGIKVQMCGECLYSVSVMCKIKLKNLKMRDVGSVLITYVDGLGKEAVDVIIGPSV